MSKKKKKNRGNVKEDNVNTKELESNKQELAKETKLDEKVEIRSFEEGQREINVDEEVQGQATLAELDEMSEAQKKMKNLVAAVILLAGVAVGSFFIDIVQFMSGDGFSKRALDNSEVLVAGDKTWVAFNEPAIEIKVLTVSEQEMESCKGCDPKEVLLWLRDYIPTMVVKNVDIESEEGKAIAEAYDVKALPTYFFSREIEETKFFQGEGRVVFAEKNGSFVLNSAGLGIPVGKYLQTPEISDKDPILGNREAKAKVVVFSDFQCPYCGEHFKNVKESVASFGEDQVALVYKDLPLSFHLQGKNAAMAARCAQDQSKFWEMGELLYDKQKEWQDTEGVAKFKSYARNLRLDTIKFNKCIDERTPEILIDEDMNQASEIGVSGTPATFIGTQFSSGVMSVAEIKEMIQRELDGDVEEGMQEEGVDEKAEEIEQQDVNIEEVKVQ